MKCDDIMFSVHGSLTTDWKRCGFDDILSLATENVAVECYSSFQLILEHSCSISNMT